MVVHQLIQLRRLWDNQILSILIEHVVQQLSYNHRYNTYTKHVQTRRSRPSRTEEIISKLRSERSGANGSWSSLWSAMELHNLNARDQGAWLELWHIDICTDMIWYVLCNTMCWFLWHMNSGTCWWIEKNYLGRTLASGRALAVSLCWQETRLFMVYFLQAIQPPHVQIERISFRGHLHLWGQLCWTLCGKKTCCAMRVPFELQYGNVGNLTDLGQTDCLGFWSAVVTVTRLSMPMTYGAFMYYSYYTDDTVHVFVYCINNGLMWEMICTCVIQRGFASYLRKC